MSGLKTNFSLDPLKATRKIAVHFVANFPLDSRAKKVKLTIKLTKQKEGNKKEVIFKVEFHFATKFMYVFCIAALHIVIRFGRNDFGIFFLWCRHNCYFFKSVVRFVSLLLLLMLLFSLLLMLLLVLF